MTKKKQGSEKKAHEAAAAKGLWRTKEGEEIPFTDLEDRHLSNILARIYSRGIHGMRWDHPATDALEKEVRRRIQRNHGLDAYVIYVEAQPYTFEESVTMGDECEVGVRNLLSRRKLSITIDMRLQQPVGWTNYRGHGLSRRQAYKLTAQFLEQTDPRLQSVPDVLAQVGKWLDTWVNHLRSTDESKMSSGESMLHGAATQEAASIAKAFHNGDWRPKPVFAQTDHDPETGEVLAHYDPEVGEVLTTTRFPGKTYNSVAEHAADLDDGFAEPGEDLSDEYHPGENDAFYQEIPYDGDGKGGT
jgi:hypothetical protein